MKTKQITINVPTITLPAMPKLPTWKRKAVKMPVSQDHINEDFMGRIEDLEADCEALRQALASTLELMKK